MRNDELGDLLDLLVEQLDDVAAQEVAHEALLEVDPEVLDQAVQIESVLGGGLLRCRLCISKLLLNLCSVELLIEHARTFVEDKLLKVCYGHEPALLRKTLNQAGIQHRLVLRSLLEEHCYFTYTALLFGRVLLCWLVLTSCCCLILVLCIIVGPDCLRSVHLLKGLYDWVF